MQDLVNETTSERPQKTDRAGPIPLADRRRLVRTPEVQQQKPKILSDWASI